MRVVDDSRRACFVLFASLMLLFACTTTRSGGQTTSLEDDGLFVAAANPGAFLRSGLFVHPLYPVRTTSRTEDLELGRALDRYRTTIRETRRRDLTAALAEFVERNPSSPWAPAVALNLAGIYRHAGRFSESLDFYHAIWRNLKGAEDERTRRIADMAAAELAQFLAYLGRATELERLLRETAERPINGTARELIASSYTGLAEMRHHPETSFRCGPMALARILHRTGTTTATAARVIAKSESTSAGLSLSAVHALSEAAAMRYQMAFRNPGAHLVMPAVLHWKTGHFAAVVGERDGRIVIADSTFGGDIFVEPSTLDREASGYFLVPRGNLPTGWRGITAREGHSVWGKGNTGSAVDFGAVGAMASHAFGDVFASSDCFGGCARWNVEAMVVGLALRDTPVGHVPAVGPAVKFRVQYSHRDALQPIVFPHTNLGRKWTHNWQSYVTDNRVVNGVAELYARGGGSEPFRFLPGATTSETGVYTQTRLTADVDAAGITTGFTRTLKDGSIERFRQQMGTQYLLTSVSDPYGNAVSVRYDDALRITEIVDAIGQVTTFSYELASDPLKVTAVTDPFGRRATLTYNGDGLLASVTDVIGLTSSFTYGAGDFINALTTPYGTTVFAYGDPSTDKSLADGSIRFVTATDTLGRTSRVEFRHDAPGLNSDCRSLPNLAPDGMATDCDLLRFRNTFVWDPHQLEHATDADGERDYTLATMFHWLHTAQDLGLGDSTSRILESVVPALENRIWFAYADQRGFETEVGTVPDASATGATNQPTAIGRVTRAGNELYRFAYNAFGNVTETVDPIGRRYTYAYAANGIDLLSVSNTTDDTAEALETYTYDDRHLPISVRHVNGTSSLFEYNAAGQLTRSIDGLGHATVVRYDERGYLVEIQGPAEGATYTYTYDAFGRVASMTDPSGTTIGFQYDDADRLTQVSFPDGTRIDYTYDRLDVASITDRKGNVTTFTHNTERELISVLEPTDQLIQFGRFKNGALMSITDPVGNTTTFDRDPAGRTVRKTRADGSSLVLAYDSMSGRMRAAMDETPDGERIGLPRGYTYYPDGTIEQRLVGRVSADYEYDPRYLRRTRITSDNGPVTRFTYYPVGAVPSLGANQLMSITSDHGGFGEVLPFQSSVTYEYDALDRVMRQTVDGAAETITYDTLGRVAAVGNALDNFSLSYVDATGRASAISSGSGPDMRLTYYPPEQNGHLKRLEVFDADGAFRSAFDYAYDAAGLVTRVVEEVIQQGQRHEGITAYGYDALGQLVEAAMPEAAIGFDYDDARNIAAVTEGATTSLMSYDSVNQLIANDVAYDEVGNAIRDGERAYEWDAAHRLVSIKSGTSTRSDKLPAKESRFAYDAFNHLIRVLELMDGRVVSDRVFFWCGDQRCLEFDITEQASGEGPKRFFPQGMTQGAAGFYYVRDLHGSLRQLVDRSADTVAHYAYAPYGERTTIGGADTTGVGYASYLHHEPTGLNFARFRVYDPRHRRWLSRDPIGEYGGLNLYQYAANSPASFADQSGTSPLLIVVYGGAGAITGALGYTAGTYVAHGFSFDGFKVEELAAATGVGALAGVVSPFVATTGGAIALMGAAGAGQYAVAQALAGKPIDPGDALVATGIGAIGGKILGPAPIWRLRVGPNSRWGVNQTWLNLQNISAAGPPAVSATVFGAVTTPGLDFVNWMKNGGALAAANGVLNQAKLAAYGALGSAGALTTDIFHASTGTFPRFYGLRPCP